MQASVLLVVDDDADAARIVQVLSRSPHMQLAVTRVPSMGEATRQLRKRRFDAIVLDFRPGEGGEAALDAAHAHAAGAALIVMTGGGRDAMSPRATELGAVEHSLATEDAFDGLAATLARACERQRHQEEVKALTTALGGKLASAAATATGSVVSGLAHEINNPLAVVVANVEEAVRIAVELEPASAGELRKEIGELKSMLQEALLATERIHLMARSLRPFASVDEREGRLDVNAIVDACCNIAAAEIRRQAHLVKDLGAVRPVRGCEPRLAQALLHVVINAAQSMPNGNVATNEIRISTAQHGRTMIVIEVADNGAGIAPADRDQVFEPLFTTKPRRAGMGLTICRAIVAAHGGNVSIHPRDGGGTIVRVVLPTLEE